MEKMESEIEQCKLKKTTGNLSRTDLVDLLYRKSQAHVRAFDRKRRASSAMIAQQEFFKEQLRKAKEDRMGRLSSLGTNQRHVIDFVAFCLNIEPQLIEEGLCDEDIYVDTLNSLFVAGGTRAVAFFYQEIGPPKIETGRYDPSLPSDFRMMSVVISAEKGPRANGPCVVVYRTKNTQAMDTRSLCDELHFCLLDMTPNVSSIVEAISLQFVRYNYPIMHALKSWGDLTKSDEGRIVLRNFLADFDRFVEFIAATELDIQKISKFEFPEDLWEGVISSPSEVMASSRDHDSVRRLEAVAENWIKKIDQVIYTSLLLRREKDTIGPNIELAYWRRQFITYSSLMEHIKSVKCRMCIQTLTLAKCQIVKVSNQMLNACKGYLTNNGKETVWQLPKPEVKRRIAVCLHLYQVYADCYHETKKVMEESPDETPFRCPEMYLFGKFETFKIRAEKISDVLDTAYLYSILKSSVIEGIAEHAQKFQEIFDTISDTDYDVLDHRKPEFEEDYIIFKKSILAAEDDLRNFLNNCLNKTPNIYEYLRTLLRFDKLQLACLEINYVFLDALDKFYTELETVRDSYNEQRHAPNLAYNVPPVSGRIMWARQFLQRIEFSMSIFKAREGVIESSKAKKVVMLYNLLISVFAHHENVYHSGWCNQVTQVRTALTFPLISKKKLAQKYVINFDPYIFELLKETEYMRHLHLYIPPIAQVISHGKKKLLDTYSKVYKLIEWNKKIRGNIPKLIVQLLKPTILKLQQALQPALSVITWISTRIDEYCSEVKEVFKQVESFTKELADTLSGRIEDVLRAIGGVLVLKIPKENSVTPEEFLNMNMSVVAKLAKDFEIKSLSIEKATTEIINKCVNETECIPGIQSKFDWLDHEGVGVTGSQAKINFVTDEAAFKDVEKPLRVTVSGLHTDCMELFNYLNERLTDALAKSTKKSLAKLVSASVILSNKEAEAQGIKPIFTTDILLQIPHVVMEPTIEEIQSYFTKTVTCILEVNTQVNKWGQRSECLLPPNDSSQYTLGVDAGVIVKDVENTQGFSNYFKQVTEHKEVIRAAMTLQGAILDYKPKIQKVLEAVLDQAEVCMRKMDAASALINGLAGERIRWTDQSAQFMAEIDRLVGDVLLLTGFLSYCGPFNQEFRQKLQKTWVEDIISLKIPLSRDLNIIDSLVDTATIGEWNLQGLPNDELSIQNGIIVTQATRFPLLIDPQNQGKSWVRNKEKDFNLVVSSLNHKYFRNHLEDCISLGMPLLIEDVGEELDPVLDNILEKNFVKIGTSYKVKVGDKEVDVSDEFRMYITTKLPNPSYTPEVAARTSMIDFTVTIKGLEDQLLGRVILSEKRELEYERTSLMQDVTSNKRKMKQLEENLLYKLTTVQGSLVDDVTVIEVLNVTKSTAAEVSEKLIIASETEIKINAAREEFRPVATRGSVLYFLIVEMSAVNCMYQTSLVQFLERFDISMARSDKSPVPFKRIVYIIEYLTFEVFKYTSRGLYEAHKFLFSLLITLKIDLERERVSFTEFETFIKGGAALDLNAIAHKPAKWITDVTWLNLAQLSQLQQFQNILIQVAGNDKAWKIWFDYDAPEEEEIPDGYEAALDVFRRLLMVRSWCPDRTISQSRRYIGDSIGEKYNDPVITNLEGMLQESRPLTPMVCFLSMGSDPTPMIEACAKKLGFACFAISMGQGQEVHARKLLSLSMSQGNWILLQNCHLGLGYMNELYLVFFETETCHPDFRCWITTEVHPQFPISLLQISIKFTNEPPQGVRAGLKRTYSGMNQDMLEYSTANEYLPLIYAISFLHSVVQERRKFGPLGWNIPYEFNSADWYSCTLFVQNHLDEIDPKQGISWNTVRYMIGEIQYGGRVTDDYDKRLLNTFAKVWFSEKLFSDHFEFYKGYKVMSFKQIQTYLNKIEELPTIETPEVYGLHANADITYQANLTTTTLNTILSIQPKAAGGAGGESRETVVSRISQEMLDKLPKDYDPFEVKERLKIMGILSSMNIFLRQELDRMQKVIRLVRTTLRDLLLAIEGTIIMNEALRDALDCIYDARIPGTWLRSSWVSSSLGFWFTEALERNSQFANWIFIKRPPQFWMTGFFNPQGFLTAMRQEVTRAHKGWALDVVALHNKVTSLLKEEVKKPPAEGVYVYGLFLEGSGWNKRKSTLCESIPKVMYALMPVVHIYAINSTSAKDPRLYTCPVYKKPNRTDLTFITPLWLSTEVSPDHWILRGVALLCDTK